MPVSEEENDGAMQLYQVHLPPGRPSPPLPYHLAFTETFQVIQGALDPYLGRGRRHAVLNPQESLTAQIGQLHTFANEGDALVRAFQLAYGIANDGGAARDGLPRNPIARLLFIRMSEGFPPGVPIAARKAVLGAAAFIARLTGVEKRLAKYLR